ncbi:MAG: nitrate reductase subunit alpha, partial [Hylemonella sp.]|nr:nitrate reductase subunit alpha [Hylemonella sp.]
MGGVCMSFYDWYCDLPPASPQIWGEQTDVPESADWYNSTYIIAWGSNVPQTRTPDAHFFTEVRYKGAKTVAVTPDYSEVAKLADLWMHPKQGTDAAMAMAMAHVIMKEFYFDKPSAYFDDYARRYTDLPMLVMLKEQKAPDGSTVLVPDRYVRASDFNGKLGQANNPEWKTVAFNEDGKVVLPQGSIGFRWGPEGRADAGKWNLEDKEGRNGSDVKLKLSALEGGAACDTAQVAFPYFGGIESEHFPNNTAGAGSSDIALRTVPVTRIALGKEGDKREALVATVFDLQAANLGIARGLDGEQAAHSFDDDTPYTPAWQEKITGVPREQVITVARQFADNADKTHGKSMIIIGAAMNHWYHSDMNYRGIINMLMLCGCIGQSGGGWAHYVGQEKLRPQTGWLPLAFALDWIRPPRQMNSTSFFYAHTDQWRYEKLTMEEIISPLADKKTFGGSLIDYNVRAERMGWLPSAPQLQTNPMQVVKDAAAAGMDPKDYAVKSLKDGTLKMSCEDPDHPANWPRNMFVWRSNLLGSSGKGHEYFLKHLLGTSHGVQGKDLGKDEAKPTEVTWHDQAPEGKLDLLVTLDFRMSTTCLYSDIVLPTATWYEKNDLNTSDMHPFIHPLSTAVDPAWQSRSDWDIYKGLAKKFSELCVGHLGVEREMVLSPLQHDTPAELAQPFDVKEWKKGECELIPGKTAPVMVVVERDYPNLYKRFTALGPLMDKIGNGGKGIAWNTQDEVRQLGELNGTVKAEGATCGMPKIESDIDACEVVLQLAPETNGHVAVKAWEALSKITGREHAHLALHREDEKIRF